MQRRKARDLMDNLELGHQTNFSASIPMRKLTKMKVVKYLILILVAVLIHTTYRLLWKTQSDIPESTKVDYEQKVESVITSFRKEEPKDDIKHFFRDDVKKDTKDITLSPLREKRRRYENFKKVIEKAKNEIHIDTIVDTEKLFELDRQEQSENMKSENILKEVEPIETIVDMQKEAIELQKEHEIENKIAEVLSEIKASEEKLEGKKIEEIIPENPKEAVLPEVKLPVDKIDNKMPTIPAPDKAFLKKANKIVEKMAVENKMAVKDLGHRHEHGIPELVTAASSRNFEQVKQLVFSLQKFYPNEKIYIFDLDLTDSQRRHLMAACNVRLREFWSNLFPDFVSNLDHYHWRPLIIQTALAEFGHILWINPGQVVVSASLSTMLKQSTDLQVKVFGQNQQHTTFAVTHRDMYKYLPTDKKKLYNSPHMDIHAMVLHNSPELINNFMKLLVTCAMEPKCLSPPETKWQCDFDFSGKQYADCHRYDESAINILLKNWFDFDNTKVLKTTNLFRAYDPNEKMAIKMCRNENDMRN